MSAVTIVKRHYHVLDKTGRDAVWRPFRQRPAAMRQLHFHPGSRLSEPCSCERGERLLRSAR